MESALSTRMLPEILLAGVCANVSSEMTQTYFRRPRKAVMVLCNSTFNKVKTQRAALYWELPTGGWYGWQRVGRGGCFKKKKKVFSNEKEPWGSQKLYQIKMAISCWVEMNISFSSKFNLSPDRERKQGEACWWRLGAGELSWWIWTKAGRGHRRLGYREKPLFMCNCIIC